MKIYYKIKNRINTYWGKPAVIPSYEFKRATLNDYKEKFALKIFVETGTFTKIKGGYIVDGVGHSSRTRQVPL